MSFHLSHHITLIKAKVMRLITNIRRFLNFGKVSFYQYDYSFCSESEQLRNGTLPKCTSSENIFICCISPISYHAI